MTEQDVELTPTPCPQGTKRCPFCGGVPMLLTADFRHSTPRWWVCCMACSADGSWSTTQGGALKLWNMRAADGN